MVSCKCDRSVECDIKFLLLLWHMKKGNQHRVQRFSLWMAILLGVKSNFHGFKVSMYLEKKQHRYFRKIAILKGYLKSIYGIVV